MCVQLRWRCCLAIHPLSSSFLRPPLPSPSSAIFLRPSGIQKRQWLSQIATKRMYPPTHVSFIHPTCRFTNTRTYTHIARTKKCLSHKCHLCCFSRSNSFFFVLFSIFPPWYCSPFSVCLAFVLLAHLFCSHRVFCYFRSF